MHDLGVVSAGCPAELLCDLAYTTKWTSMTGSFQEMTNAHDYFHKLPHGVDVLKLGMPHEDPVGICKERAFSNQEYRAQSTLEEVSPAANDACTSW